MNLSRKLTSADSASICDAEYAEFQPGFPVGLLAAGVAWVVATVLMAWAGLLIL